MDTQTPTHAEPWSSIDESLRRLINSARAAKGWTWEDVAQAVQAKGWDITAGNLMTRHSRMSFRADEWLVLLAALQVKDVPVHLLVPA